MPFFFRTLPLELPFLFYVWQCRQVALDFGFVIRAGECVLAVDDDASCPVVAAVTIVLSRACDLLPPEGG